MPVIKNTMENNESGFFQTSNVMPFLIKYDSAFRLFCYALSKPEGWIFHQREILQDLSWPDKGKLKKAIDYLKSVGLATGNFSQNKGGERSDNDLTFYAFPLKGEKSTLQGVENPPLIDGEGWKIHPLRGEKSTLQGVKNPPLEIKNKERINNNPPYPPTGEDGEGENEYSKMVEIVRIWQEIFTDGPRSIRGQPEDFPMTLSPLFQENLQESFRQGFQPPDFRRAFQTLKDGKSFNWLLHSAVKPDNLKILLTQAENKQFRPKRRTWEPDISDPDFYK